MRTKKLVESEFLEDQEMVFLAREHIEKILKCDPDSELMGVKHWESSIYMAFNEALYELAPMIMHTSEFREKMIDYLKKGKA